MKKNIIVSLILAFCITGFITKKFKEEDNLEKILHKTELTRLDGVKYDKKKLKKKVVLISFFQTWCGDCVLEQPDLLKLKSKFGDELEVLMISDESTQLIQQFKDQFQSNLDFYHSSAQLKTELNVRRYPTTYLFDKMGEVKLVKVEGIKWYTPEIIAMIEQLLAP